MMSFCVDGDIPAITFVWEMYRVHYIYYIFGINTPFFTFFCKTTYYQMYRIEL